MENIKYASYTQISPERDVNADAFSKGQINFKMNMSSMCRWNPYRSYLRMRVRLSANAGAQLTLNDGIAPNMFQGDCLWQQMNISCNGVKVSEIDDYYQQCASLRNRYSIPEGRRRGFLANTNHAESNINTRINKVSEFGVEQPISYEIFKPGNQASTIQLFKNITSNGLNLGFDGALGDYALANTGIMTFTANGGTIPNTNIFALGDIIRFVGNNNAIIKMEVTTLLTATTMQLVAYGGGDVEPIVATVGTAVNFYRYRQPQNVTGNLDGVNTTFVTDGVQAGDIIEVDDSMELIILNVISDIELLVQSHGRNIATTANWRIKRAKRTERLINYELCFKPKLGFFSLDKFLPGNWKLELTPHTNLKYQRYAIESLIDKVPINDFEFEVVDLQLYIYKGITSKVSSSPESYEFTELRCQAQTITNQTLMNKAFVVNQNSHTFTIAYQKSNAGDDTRFSKTKFKMLDNYEQNLKRYQLRLNGESIPTPLPDITIDSIFDTNYATQQYYETLHTNGTIFLDEPESLDFWLDRGPYYSYKIKKQLNGKANRLYVSSEFTGVPPEAFSLLVFDHYYKGFKLNIQNGLVTSCERSILVN